MNPTLKAALRGDEPRTERATLCLTLPQKQALLALKREIEVEGGVGPLSFKSFLEALLVTGAEAVVNTPEGIARVHQLLKAHGTRHFTKRAA